jgi:hypothetical protein
MPVQNAAVVVRFLAVPHALRFEVFEVLPPIGAVIKAKGKLLRTYPRRAMQVPINKLREKTLLELSSSLLDLHYSNSTPATSPAKSVQAKDLWRLLKDILGKFCQRVVVDPITKRIRDEVLLNSSDEVLWSQAKPWRRSPLWLVLRVSLQSSLRSSNLYKLFILFFHAHLLHNSHRDLPSELIYAMRTKMARRLAKLGPAVSAAIYRFVYSTAIKTESLLQEMWTRFQAIGNIGPALQLNRLDFVEDVYLSLDNSFEYLTKMLHRSSRDFSQMSFAPSHTFRLNDVHNFSQFGDGELTKAIAEDPHVSIADFELSVERNFQSWVATTTKNTHAVEVIASCILQYFPGAKRLYEANAEDNSIMILTIMDLWVALDKFAVKECPLLKEYSPEIPSGFLHHLLLHRSSHVNRASYIEEYLLRRHEDALEVPSVFSNSPCDTCFAVRYFRTSQDLQCLYTKINTHAQQEREKKREELASLGRYSKTLLDSASKIDHELLADKFGHISESTTCEKCRLEDQANALKIRVHEWPLPLSTMNAQLIVFELCPPRIFSAWRDITYMILRDIGLFSVPHSCDQPRTLLHSLSGLQSAGDYCLIHFLVVQSGRRYSRGRIIGSR